MASAQVTIDGTTPTTVTVNPNGSVTVGVAPATRDGVSLNRYDQFNVDRPGLNLDNRQEAARTIVNEVSGALPSRINGRVEVLGQRAHVIVANPNGVSVDGGEFVNVGRTVLTTGDITENAREIAPGIFQSNVVSNVSQGRIVVQGGGLSGQMDAIDLIAHQVRVDGPIRNTSTDPGASINVIAGASRTEFDSSVVPGNLTQTWESVTGTGQTSNGVLVELTRNGALRANRIEIQVTDQGAGARIAGLGQASSREFILRADGRIDLSGAQIQAGRDALVRGREAVLGNTAVEASEGRLQLEATEAGGAGIAATNTQLTAGQIAMISAADVAFSAETLGGSSVVTRSGDIAIVAGGSFSDTNGTWQSASGFGIAAGERVGFHFSTAEIAGPFQAQAGAGFEAENTQIRAGTHVLISSDEAVFHGTGRRTEIVAESGGLIVTTLGQASAGGLTNDGALLQGAQFVGGLADAAGTQANGAVTLDVAGDLTLQTVGDNLGVVFGRAGDVSIRSGGTVSNSAGRLLSNEDIHVVAAGDILNLVELPEGTNTPKITQYTREGKRQWWTLWLRRKRETFVSYDFGDAARLDQLAAITATGSVTLEAGGDVLNQGGLINANGGNVQIVGVQVETVGVGTGRAFVRRVCVLVCRFEGESSIQVLGGNINAANDVVINAQERFTNTGGSVVGLDNIAVNAPDAVLEAVLVPTVVTRRGGIHNFWSGNGGWLLLRDQFGGLIADAGNVTLNTRNPVVLRGVDLPSGAGSIAVAGTVTEREVRELSPTREGRIGLLHDFPVVSWE